MPAAIVTDVAMPGIDGRRRVDAGRIDSVLGAVPAFVLTGSTVDPDEFGMVHDRPLDLSPEEGADLEEVWLFANPALAGTTLTAEWSARSRDASGVIRDALEIEVDADMPTTEELAEQAEENAHQDEDDDD